VVLLESQETVGVGPEQFGEFIFPYQDAIARRFGRVYYGCCEPVHTRWHILAKMAKPPPREHFALVQRGIHGRGAWPQLRLQPQANPAIVSTERFDEDLIRRDLRDTMLATRKHGCTVEIVMKDVHTLSGQPNRLTRWVELARQATEL